MDYTDKPDGLSWVPGPNVLLASVAGKYTTFPLPFLG